MKRIRNLTFLFIIFALAVPVPGFAGVMDMQGSGHMMSMDNGDTMLCDGDMSQDNNMDCQDDCSSLCMTVTVSTLIPSILGSNSISSRYQPLSIEAQNFSSIFSESIHHPPIAIS